MSLGGVPGPIALLLAVGTFDRPYVLAADPEGEMRLASCIAGVREVPEVVQTSPGCSAGWGGADFGSLFTTAQPNLLMMSGRSVQVCSCPDPSMRQAVSASEPVTDPLFL